MPEEGLSVGEVGVGESGVGRGVEPAVLREFAGGEAFEDVWVCSNGKKVSYRPAIEVG